MKVVIDISEEEIEKLDNSIGFPNSRDVDPMDIEEAIHTLIETVC